ncbi:MAG: hypothetical protein JXA79_00965 [Deltaproteobacteria bacterium]|nr:hypothetical protein [Deltaproteobacteria bacterium]
METINEIYGNRKSIINEVSQGQHSKGLSACIAQAGLSTDRQAQRRNHPSQEVSACVPLCP